MRRSNVVKDNEKNIQHLERFFKIIWLILPIVILFTYGIFTLFFFFIAIIGFTLDIKASLGYLLLTLLIVLIFSIPTLIILFLNSHIKKHHKEALEKFYIISIIIALLIIAILIKLAIDGKFKVAFEM